MNTYSDIVKHSEFGNLYITWAQRSYTTDNRSQRDLDTVGSSPSNDQDNKYILKYIRFSPSPMDIMTIPWALEEHMPAIYEYIVNYPSNAHKVAVRTDLLDLSHCTKFATDVYRTLLLTKVGTIITYGELAKIAGYPNAHRAVGSAMRKNRFPFVIPCHRVVASNGIGGYTSNRVNMKERLIEMEHDLIYQTTL